MERGTDVAGHRHRLRRVTRSAPLDGRNGSTGAVAGVIVAPAMKLDRTAVVVVVAVSAAFVAVGTWAQDRSPAAPFTRAELARLARRELVVRPEMRALGGQRLVGGNAWVVVDAPPDAVWRAAIDFPRWVSFVPRLVSATVVRRGERPLLRMRHVLGPVDATYSVELRVDAARRDLAFSLDRSQPHDIDAAWGYFTIRPHGEARSVVVFGGMVDVGDGLVRLLFEERVHHWSLRLPDELRRWVESAEGRRRYGRSIAVR